MLLALYVASHDHRVMNVKTLVSSADAPVTTSQRWIEHLAKLGLVRRMVDPIDRRRIEVSLSDDGRRAIEAYLAAIA
jgi:DNA-binding MarR family transcriptional regulator